jgi:hypothetical protein
MYTPHVPNSLKVANRVPEFVPRTEANCEPGDYGYKLKLLPLSLHLMDKNGGRGVTQVYRYQIQLYNLKTHPPTQ